MFIIDKLTGAIIGASAGYSISLVVALYYAKGAEPVPNTVLIPTIICGVIGFFSYNIKN